MNEEKAKAWQLHLDEMASQNATHAERERQLQQQIDQINKANSEHHQQLIKQQVQRDQRHREELDEHARQAEEAARQYQNRLDTTVHQHESLVKLLNESNKREIDSLTKKFEKQLQDESTAQRQLLEKTRAALNDEM